MAKETLPPRSAERVVDSDSDEELPDASPVLRPSQIAASGEMRKRTEEPWSAREGTLPATNGQSAPSKHSGGQPDADDSRPSMDEESESNEQATTEKPTATPGSKRSKAWQPVNDKSFNPPSGFTSTKFSSETGAEMEGLFDQDLTGKELWHITAHASVPVKSIRDFSIKSVMAGNTIRSRDGVELKLTQSKRHASAPTGLLLPRCRKHDFRCLPASINRTFHLQQADAIPETIARGQQRPQRQTTIGEGAPSKAVGALKPRRAQPEGLQLRYVPFGVPQDSLGRVGPTRTEASDHQLPTFQVPPGLPSTPSEKTKKVREKKKRKHQGEGDAIGTDAARGANRKDGLDRQQGIIPTTNESRGSEPNMLEDEEKKKKKKKRKEKDAIAMNSTER